MYINIATYFFAASSILSCFLTSNRNIPLILFASSFLFALVANVVNIYSIFTIIALFTLFYLFSKKNLSILSKNAVFLAIIAIFSGLMMHEVPGFNNIETFKDLKLSENSTSFSMWWNFDKALIALFILYFCDIKPLKPSQYLKILKVTLPVFLVLSTILYHFATVSGYIAFETKIIDAKFLILWIIRMVCFVVIVEELFFRFFIQDYFSKILEKHELKGDIIACIIASLIFGFFHIQAGLLFSILAFISGLIYGGIYIKTRRIESSIILHFLINFVHLIIFTYPALQH